jgi:ADP-heptose:LPS heptosyltransferase
MLDSVSVIRAEKRARALAQEIVRASARSLDAFQQAVDELVSLALAANPEIARAASRKLFANVVETLADRFEPELCDLYVRVFCRLIATCGQHPKLDSFDRQLREFGIESEEALLRRAQKVRRPATLDPAQREDVRKAFVLSRVTLGADVAVTSVVLDGMKRTFPNAELVLLGGPKTGAFFASDSRVRLREVPYQREGSLLDRLEAWPALVETIRQETADLHPRNYLVVDPDSRLTQLGLLPLVADDSRYFFFESRSFESAGATALGALTAAWLDRVFGPDSAPSLPYVHLSAEDQLRGRALRDAASGRRLAAVNLGVGGNDAKRIPDPFESQLLKLLSDEGYAIVLDQGAGEDELACTSKLVEESEVRGATVARMTNNQNAIADLNVWRGSLSGFAGLIAVSDLYVGYDSAGGHLAAALSVLGIDIFAGASSPRMIERWRPWGPRPATVVQVDTAHTPEQVLKAVRELLP